MLLELRDLRKTFGSVVAVDGITLAVAEGEFFSLLGPSGCGKTTLLRTIAGIYAPDGGQIRLRGKEIGATPMNERNTALVFQNYALFPHLTVFENMAFGLKMRNLKKPLIRQKVEAALELVHLSGFGQRYPRQLSGGQQQRVALARALIVEPDLLLLDEPLSNLDAKLRETMRIEIRDIQRRVGITTILVTHDIHEAFAMSDRIAVMNEGRVEQIGTPRDIYSHPSTRFAAEFSGPANHLEARVIAIGDGSVTVRSVSGLELRLRAIDGEVRTGQKINLLLRPERIRLRTGAGTLVNCFSGIVEKSTFLGSTIVYNVRVSDEVLIAQENNTATRTFAPGDAVTVEWTEYDAVPSR
jgi:putative spermidine/putrescine transport system ATP-binding protein